jgi:4'-phosphopantetheinyl transferase
LHVPWEKCSIVPNPEDKNGKPVYISAPGEGKVWFNVSHQAGIVALIAVVVPADSNYVDPTGNVDVGVDVVCTSERRDRDRKMISGKDDASMNENGWKRFIDMHADVFSKGEVAYLESRLDLPLDSHGSEKANCETQLDSIDTGLRYFYALWCLREAYVKMTGEALLAPWLGDLEFRNFVPPPARPSISGVAEGQTVLSDVGPPLTDHEILFRGARVADAQVSLCALGADYMLCTAVRTKADSSFGLGLDLRRWTTLSMDEIVRMAG